MNGFYYVLVILLIGLSIWATYGVWCKGWPAQSYKIQRQFFPKWVLGTLGYFTFVQKITSLLVTLILIALLIGLFVKYGVPSY